MGTMNVSLTGELQQFAESEVASGDFASASEVVRALAKERLEILRREVKIGFDQMEAGLYSGKTIAQIADDVLGRRGQ